MLNRVTTLTVMLIALMTAAFPGLIYAAESPPLTHKLTVIDKPVKAPDLRFNNMNGETIDIKKYRGKVVVVNFWATWCPPCRREMSSLERLHLSVKDENVIVLAVNIGEDEDTVFSFLGSIEPFPSFTILFDTQANSMKEWKIRGLPTTYIVSPEGDLVYRAVGGREFDHPDIQQAILGLYKKEKKSAR